MKRVMLGVMSGLLLSCQGPAAVLAQEYPPAAGPSLLNPKTHVRNQHLPGNRAALSAHHDPCRPQ
jgi:hypothetical protein